MTVNFYTPKFYALNNFSPNAIEVNGELYPTAEHAYQAAKLLGDEAKHAIKQARSPLEAQRLANTVYKASRDPDWPDKKLPVMEKILRAKLVQHEEVREALKATKNEAITEDSPTDYYWGEGKDGTGENNLGKLWMKLRSELK